MILDLRWTVRRIAGIPAANRNLAFSFPAIVHGREMEHQRGSPPWESSESDLGGGVLDRWHRIDR